MTVHNRQTFRKKGYDYSKPNTYFITLCSQYRQHIFGDIIDGKMYLNDIGAVINEGWERTSIIRNEIELNEFVIMPNHFHALITIYFQIEQTIHNFLDEQQKGDRRVAPTGPKPNSIGAIIAGFKSASTKRINELLKTPGQRIWQRNYWDHIIGKKGEYDRIKEYIIKNPEIWESDKLNSGDSNTVKEMISEYNLNAIDVIM